MWIWPGEKLETGLSHWVKTFEQVITTDLMWKWLTASRPVNCFRGTVGPHRSLVNRLCNKGRGSGNNKATRCLAARMIFPSRPAWVCPPALSPSVGVACSPLSFTTENLPGAFPPHRENRMRKFSRGQGGLFSLPLPGLSSTNRVVLPNGRKCSLSLPHSSFLNASTIFGPCRCHT